MSIAPDRVMPHPRTCYARMCGGYTERAIYVAQRRVDIEAEPAEAGQMAVLGLAEAGADAIQSLREGG